MSYSIIQPPFTLNFDKMSKRDLSLYYHWFLEVIPQRVNELSRAVAQSPGFESWDADYSASSLDLLGQWMADQVEMRQRTKGELNIIYNHFSFPFEVPNEELTNKTFSLAFDVGIYFSQVLLKNSLSLKWIQQFGTKKSVDYGQPVLVGFGKTSLNPTQIMVTLAYGLTSKKRTGKRLRELYDYWTKQISPLK